MAAVSASPDHAAEAQRHQWTGEVVCERIRAGAAGQVRQLGIGAPTGRGEECHTLFVFASPREGE